MTTDPDDWAAWFDAHAAALVLFARQWAPAATDAEDVVHDAFVRFWPARHRAADPVAYLYACVRRAGLDWLRGRRRRIAREERAARPESAGEPPDDQRAVLVLKVWGGLTFQQVAAALDVPANTAASRYRYALAKLRDLLAEANVP